MKKVIKLALATVFMLGTTSLFAQKFGQINMQEVVMLMPETAQMQTNIETFVQDLQNNMETIQVELNTKIQDYQKNSATMAESVRQLKEKELNDLQQRLSEFQQVAQQDIAAKQNELLQPILKKAQDAVKKVAEAGAYTGVFDIAIGALAYSNPTTLIDITPEVKAELGIAADAKPAMAQ